MKSDDVKAALMLAATGAAAYVIWTTYRNAGKAVDSVTEAAGAAVDSVTHAAGVAVDWVNPMSETGWFYKGVTGIGQSVGIPETNLTQCEQDLAAGRTWDASFSCPAPQFVAGVWNSTSLSAATLEDVRRVEIVSGGGGNFQGNGATGSW